MLLDIVLEGEIPIDIVIVVALLLLVLLTDVAGADVELILLLLEAVFGQAAETVGTTRSVELLCGEVDPTVTNAPGLILDPFLVSLLDEAREFSRLILFLPEEYE